MFDSQSQVPNSIRQRGLLLSAVAILRVPHRSDAFLSNYNNTKTFREECILWAIFAEEELDHAARRNFDPERILAIAKRMLQEQICNHDVINNKLRGLNIAGMNDGELDMDQEQSTIPIKCSS